MLTTQLWHRFLLNMHMQCLCAPWTLLTDALIGRSGVQRPFEAEENLK